VAAAAATIQRSGDQFDRLTDGIMKVDESEHGAGRLLRAFRLIEATAHLRKRVDDKRRDLEPTDDTEEALVDAAEAAGVISAEDASALRDARAATLAAWEVDVFAPEDYFRDELTEGTQPEGDRARRTANG
ncbi:MAG TPA: acyl-CoA dehydrogenase domain-containing protein, partial [Pseudomonadales bacterium]|nr:acyl-CoA dehydrogenase domain-containing protein [Pseudomonadales bacterium]